MRKAPLSAKVFAGLGLASLVAGLVLAILGSFAYIGVLSVGLFFIAATLVARVVSPQASRVAAVLLLASSALLIFGLTATPLFYAGWGLLAGAVALLVVGHKRRTS